MIRSDDSVDVEPVVDRDTLGVPGSPDIPKTIFQKIASSDIIVADVSLINASQLGRRAPNPNVLLELGYALHALGDERVILVFNTAYGMLEDLPFDLRMRRVMPYSMPEIGQERSSERKALESKLDDAIRVALESIKPAPSATVLSEALKSVEKLAPNRVLVARKLMAELQARIQAKRPKSINEGATTQDLLDAIASTLDIAVDYIFPVRHYTAVRDALDSVFQHLDSPVSTGDDIREVALRPLAWCCWEGQPAEQRS